MRTVRPNPHDPVRIAFACRRTIPYDPTLASGRSMYLQLQEQEHLLQRLPSYFQNLILVDLLRLYRAQDRAIEAIKTKIHTFGLGNANQGSEETLANDVKNHIVRRSASCYTYWSSAREAVSAWS